nr:hypothetical protein [Hyphomonas atlantica]
MSNFAFAVPGKLRLGFEKLANLPLRAKATGGQPFERLLDDGGHRLIANQLFAVPFDVFVPERRTRIDVVAIHQPRLHAIDGLLAVLLGKVLGRAREHIFEKL